MNIALFDLDSSLADYEGELRANMEACMSPQDKELLKDKSLWEIEEEFPHYQNLMRLVKSKPGWWRTLPVIEMGLKVANMAKTIGFEVEICTKGPKKMPLAWAEKLEWCQHVFGPDINVHIVSNKGRVYGKVLYDDYPDFMDAWLEHRPRGLGIMPVTKENKKYSHPNVIKYDGENLTEVTSALWKCYLRKMGEE